MTHYGQSVEGDWSEGSLEWACW